MSGYEIATVSMLSCLVFERIICNFLPISWLDEDNTKRVKNIEQKVNNIEAFIIKPPIQAQVTRMIDTDTNIPDIK